VRLRDEFGQERRIDAASFRRAIRQDWHIANRDELARFRENGQGTGHPNVDA